jgi:hypothetical protein
LLAEGGRLFGHLLSDYCLGIDTPESYGAALALIERREVTLK